MLVGGRAKQRCLKIPPLQPVYLQTLRSTSILGVSYWSHSIFLLVKKNYFSQVVLMHLEVNSSILGDKWAVLVLKCEAQGGVCCWAVKDSWNLRTVTFYLSYNIPDAEWVALAKDFLLSLHVRLVNRCYCNCCSGPKEPGLIVRNHRPQSCKVWDSPKEAKGLMYALFSHWLLVLLGKLCRQSNSFSLFDVSSFTPSSFPFCHRILLHFRSAFARLYEDLALRVSQACL